MATECSWNDGSKTQYYYVILDRLLGRSGGLERAPEWRVRGPLTGTVGVQYMICYQAINRTDPQNLLSTTLDVPLQKPKKRRKLELTQFT